MKSLVGDKIYIFSSYFVSPPSPSVPFVGFEVVWLHVCNTSPLETFSTLF